MVKKGHRDKKGAEDWMAIKALTDPQDPREKQVTVGLQVPLHTSLIPPKLKVPEVTQDSQGPTGIQEAEVNQETRAHQVSPAHPSEMKMEREAYRVKWAPKGS